MLVFLLSVGHNIKWQNGWALVTVSGWQIVLIYLFREGFALVVGQVWILNEFAQILLI